MKKITTLVLAALFSIGLLSQESLAKTVRIKMATLAPEGTSWMNYLREYDAELRKKTNKRVKLKIYPGGVMGDENVVMKKIRAKQLHGAGFTGIGLGEIDSHLRILEMPFMFNGYGEIDHVVKKVSARLKKRFADKGYTILGWTETGLVHFFSKQPIRSMKDLQAAKMWAWNADPLAKVMFKEFKLKPVELDLPDVPMSLDTDIINACYATPVAALALQWAPRVKYITRQNLVFSTGALIVKNDILNKLSAGDRKIMLDLGKKYSAKITQAVRKENEDALKVFKTEGKVMVEFNLEEAKAVVEKSKVIRKSLAGKIYSKDLHNFVINERNSYRKKEVKRLAKLLDKLKNNKSKKSEFEQVKLSLSEKKEALKDSKNDLI